MASHSAYKRRRTEGRLRLGIGDKGFDKEGGGEEINGGRVYNAVYLIPLPPPAQPDSSDGMLVLTHSTCVNYPYSPHRTCFVCQKGTWNPEGSVYIDGHGNSSTPELYF